MWIGDNRQRPYVQKRAKTKEMRAYDNTNQAEGGETQASEMQRLEEERQREKEIKGEDGSVCVSHLHLFVISGLSLCFYRHLCRLHFLSMGQMNM